MAHYKVQNGIAIITVDNPPVNALSLHVRKDLVDNINKGNADRNVKAIVLVAKGRTFLAGADISEFRGNYRSGPSISDVCEALESSEKPTVAGVFGTVLGGGLEVTISAHYRLASKKTQFGFPEVSLGILPAATGTQRFPRLCGMEAAFRYIPTGQRFNVKKAQEIGMLDKVINDDGKLLEEVLDFTRTVIGKPVSHRRTSKMAVKDAHKAKALAEAALKTSAQKSKGLLAPVFCIKSVLAAAELPFEEGLAKELELSITLFTSGQARAMQYAFFAERAATKWSLPDGATSKTTKPLTLKSGAVIGAGTMGTGIAMALLNSGISVTLLEQDQKFLNKGVDSLKALYAGSVKLGKMTEAQVRMVLSQLKPTVSYGDLKNVDFVIEAVFENMAVKKDVFKKLDSVCKPSAILCSNTSYLSIDEIASATRRPDKVIGTHFFVPAYYMRMLENVRGKKTSPETIATATALGSRIGKVPVLVGNCFGFVGNRMQANFSAEAEYLIEEGASPSFVDETMENFGMTLGPIKVRDLAAFLVEEGASPFMLDQVVEDFGMPLGIFKVGDLSGLDIGWRIRQEVAKKRGKPLEKKRFVNGVRTSYLSDLLCESGRFGRKTGKGWYRYEKPGAKEPFEDPWVNDLIEKYCKDNGIVRRQISTQEITERCFYSLINEGFKVLEEGIASKPEDIDTIWLLGYGWPRQTGGPMFYANQVGVKTIYERVCHYYKERPCCPHWQPSELLKKVAENNTPMSGWTKHVNSQL